MLKRVTGVDCTGLNSSVSLSAAVYGDGDHLLCHDDELQGRRIAYILYLVPNGEADTDPLNKMEVRNSLSLSWLRYCLTVALIRGVMCVR